MPTGLSARRTALLLVAVTLAAFSRVIAADFISVDDPVYVTQNAHVQMGLTREGTQWAVRNLEAANWFPLTWLSHMLDVELFGLAPAGHHAMSALLHAANAALLFAALNALTGRPLRSAAVAGLFALHPLRVESVAWVSERKDVLSAFFWFATTYLYARYAAHPTAARYLAMFFAFAAGLASKSMLVSLPLVLALLDIWPLRRARGARWIIEKIPLLALAGAVSLITLLAQRPGIDFAAERLPLAPRVANAITASAIYIAQTVWPLALSPFYPHPGMRPLGQVASAALVLGAISALAIRWRRERPYLPIGWLWFLITLVPVIGLVQVGGQAHADRYTYIPTVGLLLMGIWGAADLAARFRVPVRAQVAAVVLACGLLAIGTWIQIGYWRDSRTLYARALVLDPDNYFALSVLGEIDMREGRDDEALRHLVEAVRLRPDHSPALSNLGGLLLERGQVEEAVLQLGRAAELQPWVFVHQYDLAVALEAKGDTKGALGRYEEAVRLNRRSVEARLRFARALHKAGYYGKATNRYEQTLVLDPDQQSAQAGLERARRLLPLADDTVVVPRPDDRNR